MKDWEVVAYNLKKAGWSWGVILSTEIVLIATVGSASLQNHDFAGRPLHWV